MPTAPLWQRNVDMEKWDIFEIIERDDIAMGTDKGHSSTSATDMPAAFFDYFVVENAQRASFPPSKA